MLRTKVHIPPLRPNLVIRSRLIEQLDEGVQPGLKLTLVSAPAGYGKTTVLLQWARASRSSVGWLSLEKADNDFERFFRYMALALEAVEPEVMETPFGILLGAPSPEKEAVLTAFINLANDLDGHTALILEDYHLIEEPDIHEALTFLLDHLPSALFRNTCKNLP
jgi:LuxR family maltose regulon positive regulatory protein